MGITKIVLIVLVFLVNLAIAQPSWADAPKLTTSPDYAQITQALTDLLSAKDAPEEAGYDAVKLQQKIGQLQLQKYILESASDWGTCRNETGKTLGIYAHKPLKKAAFTADQATLYYLGDGQETDDSWNCDGVLLPSGITAAGISDQELTEPIAVRLVPGTQFVAKANPDTGVVELNVPPTNIFKAGEGTWTIPNLSQTDVNAQAPNAPIDD